MPSQKARIAALLVCVVMLVLTALVAWGTGLGEKTRDESTKSSGVEAGPATASDEGAMAGMYPMAHELPADEYEFLVHMIPHHQEAVDTAQIVAGNTTRDDLREFAEKTISTQQAEIDRMQQWLQERYSDRPQSIEYQPMMRPLGGLEPDEMDQRFLEDMIGHHMMAIMTAELMTAVDVDGVFRGLATSQDTADFAEQIRAVQLTEVLQMEDWLQQWFGAQPMPQHDMPQHDMSQHDVPRPDGQPDEGVTTGHSHR